MTRKICWWLVDILSGALEPDECAAVRGDLAESGATGGQALCDVWGLVVRRHAGLCEDWRPWLALGLVLPVGMLLSLASRSTARGSAIYIWLYANNWDWKFLGNAVYWHDFVRFGAEGILSWLTLACWSWTGGFVVGALSRRLVRFNGAVFFLMAALTAWPGSLRHSGHDPHDLNAVVFALTFYRVVFPVIVQAAFVVLPLQWGMFRGLRLAGFRPTLRAILWMAAIATLAGLVAQDRNGVWVWFRPPGYYYSPPPSLWVSFSQQMRRLQLVVYWPVVYAVVSAIGQRWRGMAGRANL